MENNVEEIIPNPPGIYLRRKCGCEWFSAFLLPKSHFSITRSNWWRWSSLTSLKITRCNPSGSLVIEYNCLIITFGGFGSWLEQPQRHEHPTGKFNKWNFV